MANGNILLKNRKNKFKTVFFVSIAKIIKIIWSTAGSYFLKWLKKMLKISLCKFLEHISKTLSVRMSFRLYPIFRHLSTHDLQIMDSKRRLSIYEEYSWIFFYPKPRSSGIELRLGLSQINVFSLYFINIWETINVSQLIAQGYSNNPLKHWRQLVVAPI
jgi:hypothetical protein